MAIKIDKVINFFISYFDAKKEDNDLTNMKLNKLLYFAYGIYLARTGKEFFECDFVAYPYGPIVEQVYNNYSQFGCNPVKEKSFLELKSVDDFDFDEEQEEALIDVLNKYGTKSAYALSDITHKYGSPWCKTTQKKIIPKEEIKKYFEKNSPKKMDELIENTKTYGRHDEDGMLVLPADDDWIEDD